MTLNGLLHSNETYRDKLPFLGMFTFHTDECTNCRLGTNLVLGHSSAQAVTNTLILNSLKTRNRLSSSIEIEAMAIGSETIKGLVGTSGRTGTNKIRL
jgi:hypothetical protein